MKRFNILVTAGIIGIIFLILIPLPTPILDFLFILNISLSLLILVMSMYIRETLEFSVFPSLLLITTLFRLGLNISSTRKILFDNGYAGQVVKTFGQFVIRGNAVIGFIIFLIIVLVQFIVITKGSERVAEVAARFTLDAMPGKQMAIDADLNSGLIDEQQARERRSKIQREADFSQPRVLMTAGGAAACLCLIPGFPVLQILIISAGMVGGGYYLYRHQKSLVEETAEELVETEVTSEASYYKNIENVYGLLNVEQIEMEFGYSLIPLADEGNGGNFIDRVVMFRKQMALDMGFVIPSVRIKDSGQLNPNQYSILLKGEEVARGDILMDHYLALPPGTDADDVPGIDTIDPAFHIPAKWISGDRKIQAELAGYTLIDPTSVVITHLSEVVKEHLHELLNRQEVNNLLEALKKTNSSIVEDTIPAVISVGGLQKVLANLLREEIPIRDMETIVETLGDYGSQVKDTDMLTEYVRQALKRTISRRFSEAGQMKVISLDDRIENMIMSSVKKMDTGSYLALEPTAIQSIVASATAEINKIKDLVNVPIVLTSPVVRIYFKKLIDQFYPNVAVVSFSEIDNNIQIQALGNISLSQR